MIGALICAVESGMDKVSATAEAPLVKVLQIISSLIRLVKITRKAGSIVDGTRIWFQTIVGLCSTFIGILIAIIVFISYPFWIVIFTIFNLGLISNALKPLEKELIKKKEKIKELILKVKTGRRIDAEMKELRQELKSLK